MGSSIVRVYTLEHWFLAGAKLVMSGDKETGQQIAVSVNRDCLTQVAAWVTVARKSELFPFKFSVGGINENLRESQRTASSWF